jgi:hypothetical protein
MLTSPIMKLIPRIAIAVAALSIVHGASAGVLPEDRADVMYHSYDGGGVKVDGPSLLVRKKLGEQVSVSANYYVDMVTSASIDVKTSGASEYKEERKQKSIGVDYLRGKSTYNLSFINSKESDYEANTASFGVSEDMFGDLTTVSLGYTRAWDDVSSNTHVSGVVVNTHEGKVDHRSYRVGLSQILTKHLILGLNYESQTHEGYLKNPYRSIRFLLPNGQARSSAEIYPGTRTTNAIALDGRYYLPYRATIHGSYRYYTDTWGIGAHTAELGYTHPWGKAWTFDAAYRYHTQRRADFFSDLFPRANFSNFMARDRNLATLKDQSIHVGVSYDLLKMEAWTHSWLNKGTVNLFFDHVQFNFADFRDARMSDPAFTANPTAIGAEPLYSESANIVRFFVSMWF